jgi:hypothetical protein
MFSLKKRIAILGILWLIVAVAFAIFAPTDDPEDQQPIRALLAAPLLFAFGLMLFFSTSPIATAVILAGIFLYLYAQLACILGQGRRRPILIFSALHLLLTAASVVKFVQSVRDSAGP